MFWAAPLPWKASFTKGWVCRKGQSSWRRVSEFAHLFTSDSFWIELQRESVDTDTFFHVQATYRHYCARLRALSSTVGQVLPSGDRWLPCSWEQTPDAHPRPWRWVRAVGARGWGRAEYWFEHLSSSHSFHWGYEKTISLCFLVEI